jgi:hypothetical protein
LCLFSFASGLSPIRVISNDDGRWLWSPHECFVPNLVGQNIWDIWTIGHYF